MNPDVVIVGGGIAGLAAAHRLKRQAPGLAVTVLESEARLGGKIVTERAGGFVVEGGPDAFLSSKPRGVGLCLDLGLEDRLQGIRPQAGRARVMHAGRLYELPEGLTGLVPARLGPLVRSPLLSPWGKLRLALDWLLPGRAAAGDEALAAFLRRRLGREAYARLVEPLMSGIYAGDGEQLSLDATFPQLRQLERTHGGLLRGVRAAGKPAANPRPAFLTLPGGMAELVEALAARLAAAGTQVITGGRVTAIGRDPETGGYRLQQAGGAALATRAVIVATPAGAAGALLEGLDDELARQLGSLPYVAPVTVSLAYRQADLPDALTSTGYLVPRAEGRAVLACTFTSAKFAGRAPADQALLRVFLGRAGQPEVLTRSDVDLERLATDELRQTLGLKASPVGRWIFRWPEGLPQYNLGHRERLAAIHRRQAAHPGLGLAGAAYQGVGIPDCIASGEKAAEQTLAWLTTQEPAYP